MKGSKPRGVKIYEISGNTVRIWKDRRKYTRVKVTNREGRYIITTARRMYTRETVLAMIEAINETCPRCNGTGKVGA